jgi:hypothetical protein
MFQRGQGSERRLRSPIIFYGESPWKTLTQTPVGSVGLEGNSAPHHAFAQENVGHVKRAATSAGRWTLSTLPAHVFSSELAGLRIAIRAMLCCLFGGRCSPWRRARISPETRDTGMSADFHRVICAGHAGPGIDHNPTTQPIVGSAWAGIFHLNFR